VFELRKANYFRFVKNEIRIVGLTIRQKNAIMKAFVEGKINELVNENYMKDIFAGDQIYILPLAHQENEDTPTFIQYITEN
jgi:hypothetical protein